MIQYISLSGRKPPKWWQWIERNPVTLKWQLGHFPKAILSTVRFYRMWWDQKRNLAKMRKEWNAKKTKHDLLVQDGLNWRELPRLDAMSVVPLDELEAARKAAGGE